MVDYSDLDSDGQTFADESADKFVNRTFNADNYTKQEQNSLAAANGEDGFQSATAALAESLGVSESQLSSFDSNYTDGVQRAVDNDAYRRGLEASGVDDPDAWRDRWLANLQ